MSNSWFRFYHSFANNSKVQVLSEINQRRFILALCSRCRYGDKPQDDNAMAYSLNISRDEWVETKATLVTAHLINEMNVPCGWDRHQYISDSSTKRVTKHREKKKQQRNVSVTPPDTDTDTDTDTETETDTDTDIDINASTHPGEKGGSDKSEISYVEKKTVPYEKIINLYHERLPDLPAVAKLTSKRKAQVRQRFLEDLSDLDCWRNFFDYVDESDFLMGRVQPINGRTIFRADFEWLTHSGNFTKISEGKYHV